MKAFDIEFEVNQKILYKMYGVEAETPQQALEIAKHEDFDRHDAEEDTLLDSWDDTDTIKVVGERISNDNGVSSHREAIDPPIKAEPTPFQIYKNRMGNVCPICCSEHIIAHPFNADGMEAWRDVECGACDETWREMFTMQNIDIL